MLVPTAPDIRSLGREALHDLVFESAAQLLEDEALAVLDNPQCSTRICEAIARIQRLTGFRSVRVKLVAHRAAPRAQALKLVHYLYWADLLRLSVDVTVPAAVRRAIEQQMLVRIAELTLGEKVAAARSCSGTIVRVMLEEPDERIFEALLINPRLREEDLVALASSETAPPAKLRLLAADRKWSRRLAIRRALAGNPATPRGIAAAQLPHLSSTDLARIYRHPATPAYVRLCIERLKRRRLSDG